MKNKFTKMINIILYILLGIILLINLFILYQAKLNNDEIPAIFGYKPFIVMSGSITYSFDSININPGETFTILFAQSGTWSGNQKVAISQETITVYYSN